MKPSIIQLLACEASIRQLLLCEASTFQVPACVASVLLICGLLYHVGLHYIVLCMIPTITIPLNVTAPNYILSHALKPLSAAYPWLHHAASPK